MIGYLVGGRWKMERRVAEGGMGVVYEATHHEHGQRVAVKILQTVLRMDSLHIDRFYHEARILQRLRHPSIVSVFEFGFEESMGFYLVMELLQGCGLDQYAQIHQGHLSIEHLCHIFVQICEGMHYAHEDGVLHRDLKPENIFVLQPVEEWERVKILDFGVGKILEDKLNSITQKGKTVGTPRYISPEQAVGMPIDRRTDVYSLAVILFEILTGGPVFKASNPAEYMQHHVFTDPPFLSEVVGIGRYPQGLEDLLSTALAKHPDSRPPDMMVFKEMFVQSLLAEGIALPQPVLDAMTPQKEEPIDEDAGGYIMTIAKSPEHGRRVLVDSLDGDPSSGSLLARPESSSAITNLAAEKRALMQRRQRRGESIAPVQEAAPTLKEQWEALGILRWFYFAGALLGMIILLLAMMVIFRPAEEEPTVPDKEWSRAIRLWNQAAHVEWLPHLKPPPAPPPPSKVPDAPPQMPDASSPDATSVPDPPKDTRD
jgi:serine/threonine protein kinase